MTKIATRNLLHETGDAGRFGSILTAERLDVRRGYYRLTQRGVALLGGRAAQIGPLGPQAILERFAILWFIAVDRPGRRTLINPKEFPEQFALGPQRLPRANFYIEEDEQGRRWFGYIVVDHGGHVRRIVSKTVRVVTRFLKRGWFEEFFASGRFVVTVLTLSGAKQKSLQFGLNAQMQAALRYALSRFEHPRPLITQVAVVPGLVDLIPGPTANAPSATRVESSNESGVASTTESQGDLS